jgi:hypothetical protein
MRFAMPRRPALTPLLAWLCVACGASTGLLGLPESPEEGARDAAPDVLSMDSGPDVPLGDTSPAFDTISTFDSPDSAPDIGGDAVDAGGDVFADIIESFPDSGPDGACGEGLNTEFPPGDCSGDMIDWFASPYVPAVNISVDSIQVHFLSGNVAVLSSVADSPGGVLFEGAVSPLGTSGWSNATVSPPLDLTGGGHYFLAFQGGCSFAGGRDTTEFTAHSVEGPWSIDGTDSWTARVIGTCGP